MPPTFTLHQTPPPPKHGVNIWGALWGGTFFKSKSGGGHFLLQSSVTFRGGHNIKWSQSWGNGSSFLVFSCYYFLRTSDTLLEIIKNTPSLRGSYSNPIFCTGWLQLFLFVLYDRLNPFKKVPKVTFVFGNFGSSRKKENVFT